MGNFDFKNATENIQNPKTLWIFGYGSILWQTGFKYEVKKIGHIEGYERVFWQGNVTHRGTCDNPGRVATLIPAQNGCVWGAAYLLADAVMIADALSHLQSRECTLGGYASTHVTFHPRDCTQSHTLQTLTFLALPDNSLYLGPAAPRQMAPQILDCAGPNGSNAEYVLFLAWFLRKYVPQSECARLRELEEALLEEIAARGHNEQHYIRPALMPHSLCFSACATCQVRDDQVTMATSEVEQAIQDDQHSMQANVNGQIDTKHHSKHTTLTKSEPHLTPSYLTSSQDHTSS